MRKYPQLSDVIENVLSRVDRFPLRAPSLQKWGFILSLPVTLAPLGYVIYGCSHDWIVLFGFVVDIFGAMILAIPDLSIYNKVAYGGRVREAYLRLVVEERGGRIAPETRYYDVFHTALRESLLPRDVPEIAYFDVESRDIDDVMLIKNERFDTVTGPISVGNIERDLISTYRSEDSRFRRLGLFLLITGFSAQLLGMIVNHSIVPGIC